jgi:diadenylate cyclase
MPEWSELLDGLRTVVSAHWKTPLEILLLAGVIYYLLLLFRGTRGAAVFMGLVVAMLLVGAVTQLFQFHVISWLLDKFLAFMAIGLLVIFQPEMRRLLAELGSQYLFGGVQERGELIDVIVETAKSLSQKKCGALMAIEREVGFRGIAERGVAVNAKATPELLGTIFFPNTPLHDGGVILRGDHVVAAACILPLTQRESISPSIGTRHRAAIGITEETDAVAVVVSEETGDISVAHRGHLVRGLDPEGLRAFLSTTLMPTARQANFLMTTLQKWFGPLPLLKPLRRRGIEAEGFSDGALTGEHGVTQERPSASSTRDLTP